MWDSRFQNITWQSIGALNNTSSLILKWWQLHRLTQLIGNWVAYMDHNIEISEYGTAATLDSLNVVTSTYLVFCSLDWRRRLIWRDLDFLILIYHYCYGNGFDNWDSLFDAMSPVSMSKFEIDWNFIANDRTE